MGELIASARLGELQLPLSDPLPIIRRRKGVLKGSMVRKVSELREERNKKKEEETKSRHYRIATAIIPYIVRCSVLFVRPLVSFIFKI